MIWIGKREPLMKAILHFDLPKGTYTMSLLIIDNETGKMYKKEIGRQFSVQGTEKQAMQNNIEFK